MSSRSGVGYSAVMVLLVALGAAVEVYDEPTPGDVDIDMAYQEDNDIDTGPIVEKLHDRPLISAKDVLMYQLLRELQGRDARSRLLYRTNWHKDKNAVSQGRNVPISLSNKDPVHKRLTSILGRFSEENKNPESTRPQQKWKIKKGKAIGSQMVCYFKLCAFRSPA
ncbi:uncharacterized protein LOC116413098 [Galleria mellonella]|uniref:Uncharacterized protein LOC116413098 n=1 Tax=Galleria mellonella TaxID=7137 RepID=A0A6J3BZX4_GALME|nr:uncharacterized protein LOC116413098 [Galleria mellonella]